MTGEFSKTGNDRTLLKWNLNINYLEQPASQRKGGIFGLLGKSKGEQSWIVCGEELVWSEQALQLKSGESLGNSLVFLLL